MRSDDLDFPLPEERIAREPTVERSASRLLSVNCGSGACRHGSFLDLPRLLAAGDLLVMNDTRVVPARIRAHKPSGGAVEGLWLEACNAREAIFMLSGGRLRPGTELFLDHGKTRLRLIQKLGSGRWLLEHDSELDWLQLLEASGETPLPPYILRRRQEQQELVERDQDRERYQTIWARAAGAVAAPTASLHFDDAVLSALMERGVRTAFLTLHVGAGTFLPIATERLEDHPMHEESFEVPRTTLQALVETRKAGRRVVAVGTTVCRVLEHLARTGFAPGDTVPEQAPVGQTGLFLRPGSAFGWTDVLLTNFHTPRSTLLALVAAFAESAGARAGLDLVKRVYAEAVAREYRFYSYGDASLWLP